jgi:hypothetical protein
MDVEPDSMNVEFNRQVSEAQRLLEEGFQQCLHLTLNLQHEIEMLVRQRTGFLSLSSHEILKHLYALAPRLYRVMADTLFRLLALLQPSDCLGQDRINFYFWPGYHSYLANRRILIQKKQWKLGVGISAAPEARTFQHYCDCSQARWYQYLIKPRNKSYITPTATNVHLWLLRELPEGGRDSGHRLDSLTVTTKPQQDLGFDPPEFFKEHRVLRLGKRHRDTEEWGARFSDFVHRIDRTLNESVPATEKNHQHNLQDTSSLAVKAKMQSVWLHAAFCDYKPEWLDRLIEDLASGDETLPASEALRAGLNDPVAINWGDATTKRPTFCCWTNLTLRPWLDPSKLYDFKSYDDTEGPRRLASQTMGSAEMLCSIPLRPNYFAFVRPWISEVYSMVRNAEIAILIHNQKLGAREPMLAGPYFAHEIKKLVDDALPTVKREAADTSTEAVRNRRFLLHSIGALTNLAYSFTNAVLSMDKQALQKERQKFLTSLCQLQQADALVKSLRLVAQEVYKSVRRERGGQVFFLHSDTSGWEPESLNGAQQSACFLLTAEMIRRHCNKEENISVAQWSASVEASKLIINLTGPTRAQRNPVSMSFVRLDVFLHSLDIGEATVFWNKREKECSFTVKVDLSR